MEKNFFLQQILPRLLAVTIFLYLPYALVYKQDSLSMLHIWILLVVLILSILPSRLRVPGIIDFSAKFDAFKQETQREISEIKNIVNNTVQTQATAVQRQLSIIHLGKLEFKDIASLAQEYQQKDMRSINKQAAVSEWNQKEFLSRADLYLTAAFNTFFIARGLQIAQKKERLPKDGDYPDGSIREKTSKFLDELLSDGISIFIPDKEVKSIEADLKQLKVLLTTYDQVSKGNTKEPTQKTAEELFDKVRSGIGGISAGCLLLSANLALFRSNMSKFVGEMRTKYLGENIDDNPNSEKI